MTNPRKARAKPEAVIYTHCNPKLKARAIKAAAAEDRPLRWAVEQALSMWCDAREAVAK
jgi:hypothetical protein